MTDGAPTWATSIRGPRAFEAILAQLERALRAGELQAGDRLPAERELAERFGVSRTSVREALRVLEALGLLDVRRGAEGVRLRDAPGDAFADLMRLHVALGHYAPERVIELRAMVESWAAAELAGRADADADALARLDALAARMDDPTLEALAFHALDVGFHDTLVSSAGNELARLLHRGSRTLIHAAMRDALLGAGDWPAARADLAREHRAICDALRAGDPAAGAALLREHVTRWGARALTVEAGTDDATDATRDDAARA